MTRLSLAILAAVGLASCRSSTERVPVAPGIVGAAPVDVVVRREPWTFERREGQMIETRAHRIHATETSGYIMSRFPLFMEMALDHYVSALTPLPMPEEKLRTFLFATRDEWASMTRQVMGRHASTYLRITKGGFASEGRAVLYDIGRRETFTIAAHEGWHQYVQATFVETLPCWLDEGLATYMEGYRWDTRHGATPVFLPWANLERHERLRDAAARGHLVSLRTLLNCTPQELLDESEYGALTYYAQVWALAHFLAEEEPGALHAMLRDASEGRMARQVAEFTDPVLARRLLRSRKGDAVFQAYFGADLDAFEARYGAFIDRITRVGSRDAIVRGVRP
ncbi:MAG: DUF1570 domain-containing protein [Phycisphaerales bacterium]|nr:DUF1570 domain-containing protein [Phycisphaerales bacterium]